MARLVCLAAIALFTSPLHAAAPPAVTAVAYQPDGHRIAFGSNGEVRVFGDGGEKTGVLKGQDGRVTAITYSPDGKRLAVASGSPGKAGVVRLYFTDWLGVPRPINPLATIAGHTDIIHALAFSPDSATLATSGYDRVIHLWDIPAKFPADSPTTSRLLSVSLARMQLPAAICSRRTGWVPPTPAARTKILAWWVSC